MTLNTCDMLPTLFVCEVLSANLEEQVITVDFLIGRAKLAPHWGVQSRFRVIYIFILYFIFLQ